jgi:hypothetical protein
MKTNRNSSAALSIYWSSRCSSWAPTTATPSRNDFSKCRKNSSRSIHRVEDKGWLQSEWKESETGRQAKFYSLTKKGSRHMNAEVIHGQRLPEAVGLVLRRE